MPSSSDRRDSSPAGPAEHTPAYRKMVDRMPGAAAGILSPAGVILAANTRLATLLRVPPDQLPGAPLERFVAARHRPILSHVLQSGGVRKSVLDVALSPEDPAGRYVKLLLRELSVGGEAILFLVAIDVSRYWSEATRLRLLNEELEARVAERTAELQVALADKDMLLQEVHHRTKNNLQMLCDLLYLQMDGLEDADQRGLLQDTYARIYAIAKLHEQLYQSLDRGRISVGKYLERLVEGVQNLHEGLPIRVQVSGDEPELDADRAIHLGLMVNELLTNAAKHAFPDGARGEAGVRVRSRDGRLELQVWDTGRGLPAGVDLEAAHTLGLRIVRILSRRLHAEVGIESSGGTRVSITLPLRAEAETPA
jgi:two-component sensor histidine kinase